MGSGVSGLPRALGPGFVGPGRVRLVCDRCWGWFEGGGRKRRLCGAGLGAGGALPPLRSSGRLLRGLELCMQGVGRGVACERSGSLGLYVLALGCCAGAVLARALACGLVWRVLCFRVCSLAVPLHHDAGSVLCVILLGSHACRADVLQLYVGSCVVRGFCVRAKLVQRNGNVNVLRK